MEIEWTVWMSKRILCISFTRTDLCIHHLTAWLSFSLLHNSQWVTFLTLSCLLLRSFVPVCYIHLSCDYLFHFSLNNQHLLIFCILSIFSKSIWHYFMLLLIDSLSLLRFPLLSHVQIILWAISLICCLKYLHSFFFF